MATNHIELCWQITASCNENCRFCHFFTKSFTPLPDDDKIKILENLILLKIPAITWSGGEALLYKGLRDLICKSHEKGITNRLITNGQIAEIDIFKYLDELVISLDSVDSTLNEKLGRGYDHFRNIQFALMKTKIHCPNLPIRINTVVMNVNKDSLDKLYAFIMYNNIKKWRISKFTPLRGRAVKNADYFSISDMEFDALITRILEWNKNAQLQIETRKDSDFEDRYFLILPDGNAAITRGGKDVILGPAKNFGKLKEITDHFTWLV